MVAKRNSSRPHIVRVGKWYYTQVMKLLDNNEQLMDVSFRPAKTPLGPAGWGFVIQRTVLGKSFNVRIVIGRADKVPAKEIERSVQQAHDELDKIVRMDSLSEAGIENVSKLIKPNP